MDGWWKRWMFQRKKKWKWIRNGTCLSWNDYTNYELGSQSIPDSVISRNTHYSNNGYPTNPTIPYSPSNPTNLYSFIFFEYEICFSMHFPTNHNFLLCVYISFSHSAICPPSHDVDTQHFIENYILALDTIAFIKCHSTGWWRNKRNEKGVAEGKGMKWIFAIRHCIEIVCLAESFLCRDHFCIN